MAKNPGCWARVLDNCKGALTGEHLISVAVWAAPSGKPPNRRSKEGRKVAVLRGELPPREFPHPTAIRNLTAHVLCEFHNEATSSLDTEGGRFARAIETFNTCQHMRSVYPGLNWNLRRYTVDGKLLERWFLKTAITNAVNRSLPIGTTEMEGGQPSLKLVEMVFGLRPVVAPVGLSLLTSVGLKHDFGEVFSLMYYDYGGTQVAGAVVTFRTLCFMIHFIDLEMPVCLLPKYLGMPSVEKLRPLGTMNSDYCNVELTFDW